MRTFTLGKVIIICESGNTRNGFKHTATLYINEFEICKTKCLYLNKTWEYYRYQSVFHKILNNTNRLTKRQKTLFRKKYDGDRFSI